MHRLLFLNIEEVVSHEGMEKLLRYYPQRYLLRAGPGDIVVVPDPVPADFLAYAKKLRGLGDESGWLVVTGRNKGKFCAVQSLLENSAALHRLEKLCAPGTHLFVPYFQTPKALGVARRLRLKAAASTDLALEGGMTAALNNKLFFKLFCRTAHVPVLPDCVCDNEAALAAAVERMGKGGRRLILKRTVSGGGYGNLSGTAKELLAKIPQWYRHGELLVEPHVGDERVVGALAEMHDGDVRFIGLDRQLCENDAWRGCVYPFAGRGAAEIKKHTLKLARILQKRGLRGQLNLDWFDTAKGVFAIECNFRDNGFGYTLELAQSVFGLGKNCALRYCAALKLNKKHHTLSEILAALERFNALRAKAGHPGGAVLCGKPHLGHADLLLAAKNPAALQQLTRAAFKELS